MSNIKKLFLVRTKAATAYVVADGMDNAYAILRKWLDDRDYGITANRELGSVEVVAVERDYMGRVRHRCCYCRLPTKKTSMAS